MDTCSISSLERLKISRRPFPLKYLLLLYVRARRECYLNYHAGFKNLYDWLAPIDIPAGNEYKKKMPDVFNNWEIQELARICGCSPDIIFNLLIEIYSEYLYGSSPTKSII